MSSVQLPDDSETLQGLQRAREGDLEGLNALLDRYRGRLRRMIRLRLNQRLHGRVDPSDVIQDAFVEVSRVLPHYLDHRPMPFYLWLRHLTGQKLIAVHRRHLGAQMRSAGREVSLRDAAGPEGNSALLAIQLVGKLTGPSQAAMRLELKARLQEGLDSMEPIDREVLMLRHFEQLSNSEAALVLELSDSAASKRYVRALDRLARMLNPVSRL